MNFRKIMLRICSEIHDQSTPFIMAKICNINFWIGNDPPPLRNFSENSSVLERGCFPKSDGYKNLNSFPFFYEPFPEDKMEKTGMK